MDEFDSTLPRGAFCGPALCRGAPQPRKTHQWPLAARTRRPAPAGPIPKKPGKIEQKYAEIPGAAAPHFPPAAERYLIPIGTSALWGEGEKGAHTFGSRQ